MLAAKYHGGVPAVNVSDVVQCMPGDLQYLETHTQHLYVIARSEVSGNPVDGGIVRSVDDRLVLGTQRLHASNMVKVVMSNQDSGEIQLQGLQGVHHRLGVTRVKSV